MSASAMTRLALWLMRSSRAVSCGSGGRFIVISAPPPPRSGRLGLLPRMKVPVPERESISPRLRASA
jgi:hypothetical protein